MTVDWNAASALASAVAAVGSLITAVLMYRTTNLTAQHLGLSIEELTEQQARRRRDRDRSMIELLSQAKFVSRFTDQAAKLSLLEMTEHFEKHGHSPVGVPIEYLTRLDELVLKASPRNADEFFNVINALRHATAVQFEEVSVGMSSHTIDMVRGWIREAASTLNACVMQLEEECFDRQLTYGAKGTPSMPAPRST